jgi:threonine dehydrogenase-like Zn-dependent dehydrogenase
VRVAVYHGAGRITLEERPDPQAGPGELVVRVRACGLCGSDLMGWYQDPRAPVVLGHEPVGEVVAAGPGAPLAPGARQRAQVMQGTWWCTWTRAPGASGAPGPAATTSPTGS